MSGESYPQGAKAMNFCRSCVLRRGTEDEFKSFEI